MSYTQARPQSVKVVAQKRQWPWWVEWLLKERVTWADRLAERLKRRGLDAWEDHQLAAFWATNPQPRKHERLSVEVGTVHDSHGSIPDHCAAALHLPKVSPPVKCFTKRFCTCATRRCSLYKCLYACCARLKYRKPSSFAA